MRQEFYGVFTNNIPTNRKYCSIMTIQVETTATNMKQSPKQKSSNVSNTALFLKRWLANPLQMGSVIPSSPALCRRVAAQIRRNHDQIVLELGAGTGVISKALLESGIPPERLFVVEIVPDMAVHLRKALPGVQVIEGDARELPALLPAQWHGRVGSIVCGIPLVLLPLPAQKRFIDAMEAVAPGMGFLHYSYCATSPLPARKHGLTGKREAWTPLNFPPASVWRYQPQKG
ncbi:Phosphatidyl-N-methylethanolamine N-methyltransferase [Granulibacter bethesdensis]|nr:Phosphatidyl-N-methylethanolamine N-methyltransferase [Granulibacter bethesdensis]